MLWFASSVASNQSTTTDIVRLRRRMINNILAVPHGMPRQHGALFRSLCSFVLRCIVASKTHFCRVPSGSDFLPQLAAEDGHRILHRRIVFVCVCVYECLCVCVCANALSQLGRNFYPFDVYCRQVITWSNNAHTCQNTNRRCLRGLRFLSHCTSCTRVLAMLKIQLVSLAARWCIQAHSADVGWRCCFATACKETAPPCSGPAKLESSIGSPTTRDS